MFTFANKQMTLAALRQKAEFAALREDANETVMLARQLLALESRFYETLFAPTKARKLIPVDQSVPAGATSHSYARLEQYGAADVVDDFAADLPRVDLSMTETQGAMKTVAASYAVSLQEMRSAAFAGLPIDSMKASSARLAIEQKINALAFAGESDYGFDGFCSHPSVGVATPTVTAGWVAGTAANCLKDLKIIADLVRDRSSGVFEDGLTMVMHSALYAACKTKAFGSDANERSVLDHFLSQSASHGVTEVEYLPTGQIAAGRVMVYKKTPEVCQMVINEAELLSPQWDNLAMKVPAIARFGGIKFRYPIAAVYVDSLA